LQSHDCLNANSHPRVHKLTSQQTKLAILTNSSRETTIIDVSERIWAEAHLRLQFHPSQVMFLHENLIGSDEAYLEVPKNLHHHIIMGVEAFSVKLHFVSSLAKQTDTQSLALSIYTEVSQDLFQSFFSNALHILEGIDCQIHTADHPTLA
jgi:hypothetical protein